jgi:hypothetical protein
MLSSAFVFMFVLILSYILTNVFFFYPFDSGQQPTHPMNGNTLFRFMNVFRLTLDHVLL